MDLWDVAADLLTSTQLDVMGTTALYGPQADEVRVLFTRTAIDTLDAVGYATEALCTPSEAERIGLARGGHITIHDVSYEIVEPIEDDLGGMRRFRLERIG
jgi:hypothetical protein